MSKSKRTRKDWQTPSAVAVAATFQTGAGKHGGTARAKNRRDRSGAKLQLRRSPDSL